MPVPVSENAKVSHLWCLAAGNRRSGVALTMRHRQ